MKSFHECRVEQDGMTIFPMRLHQMLEETERDGNTEIVSWLPDGKKFKVHDHATFMEAIVPNYFSLTKFKSFRRQLRMYGFERIANGPCEGSYFHKNFIRGQRMLCGLMTRETGNASCKSSSVGRKSTQAKKGSDARPKKFNSRAGSKEESSIEGHLMPDIQEGIEIASPVEEGSISSNFIVDKTGCFTPYPDTPLSGTTCTNVQQQYDILDHKVDGFQNLNKASRFRNDKGIDWLTKHNQELLRFAFGVASESDSDGQCIVKGDWTGCVHEVANEIISTFGTAR